MSINRRAVTHTIRAAIGAAILSSATVASVVGYEGEIPATVTVTAGGAVLAGQPIPVCATVLGPSGTGVPDVTVTFDITSAPAGADDVLSSTTDVTDADGVACVQLTLDAVVGSRTITASTGGAVLGSITIVLAAAGLPNTATAPGSAALVPMESVLIALLATAAAIGLFQHRALRRRGNNS